MVVSISTFAHKVQRRLKYEWWRLLRAAKSRRKCLLVFPYFLPSIRLETLVKQSVPLDDIIFDDICLPPYFGPNSHDDITPLMQILVSAQPDVVVELGTAHGNTVANICRQCPDATLFTVNSPASEQTGNLTTYELSVQEIGRVYRAYGFSERVHQIYKNTLELDLAPYLKEALIDVAIIDACHDAEYVINDFHKVRPFMKQNGIVLFHDTHPSMEDHLVGSYVGCTKLRRQGYEISHLAGTWWGVWINKSSGQPCVSTGK